MEKDTNHKPVIIGAGEIGGATPADMCEEALHKTNALFWSKKGGDVLGTTALPFYGAFISEENHHLLGNIAGKKVLEIGCGNGRSLQYLGARNTSELWGIDLSEEQLQKTATHLAAHGLSAKLICSPMEEECGLPALYFDVVYSVYAIGWTTDLKATLCRIATYLKKSGTFIFSWSHPIHKCVALENGQLVFKKCYFDENWYSVALEGGIFSLSDRTLSTYINALASAGFIIEEMIEQPDNEILQGQKDDFARKAEMLPVTFVVKATKR
ncbi:MAG: class I SAM-dependent methyltransferase [Oscillospiraceae bacterium]